MHRLFFKLFFGFLAFTLASMALSLILAFTASKGPWGEHRQRVRQERQEMFRQSMELYGYGAVAVLKDEGLSGYQDYRRRFLEKMRTRTWLLYPDLTAVTGDTPPPAFADALGRVAGEREGVVQFVGEELFVLTPVLHKGERWFMAALVPLPPHAERLLFRFPKDLGIRFWSSIFLAVLLCWAIARHITEPIARLRSATRNVAAGDLLVRVAPDLGNRRDELGLLARDFDAMTARMADLLEARDRLLRDISHELRSPLARMAVALELARKDGGNGAAFLRMEMEMERLNAMIGEILTLARLASGKDEGDLPESMNFSRLVMDIVADADFEAQGERRSVVFSGAEDLGLKGFPTLLHRAVENVVRNALRHTPEEEEVRVFLSLEGEEVVLRVEDPGPGVPEEALVRIFEPFYRVEDHRDRRTGGVGLGLAITGQAVRRHGGRIRAENRNPGFCVEIRLPLFFSPIGRGAGGEGQTGCVSTRKNVPI
ncbi:ATP-binding protein [Desulfobotulus sp.]|jgi:two-component system sensor histidine kinase CpxA|uniref:ATP-binding protein n=1 Tax=Desulfobotulus sp. TaxID=1940337 RepID=UPI002A370ABB|nr:ATP-binding protein [Desulfobotulus sp.]MDY0162070.1 ATP-binding protein [Desulfobotulus sp.]